ncbi:retrovirus-related pol polyprotein from transposon TNT 1-94 [Tanacetum coccineum]
MENSDKFVQPAIPKFDGHFDHWALLMKNFLRSKEMWSLVENGVPEQTVANPTEPQRKAFEEAKLKDLKALRREYELLSMKEGEKVDAYLARTLKIMNKMKANGEQLTSSNVVAKVLRSLSPKFNYVVCFIEESNNLDTMTIDELHGSLLVHEQRMIRQQDDEQALKISNSLHSRGRGRGRGGRGGRGRGRLSFDKSTIECYNYHKLGHLQNECPDSLDESYRNNVRLENDVRMAVMGKENVQLDIKGVTHTLIDVYYVPGLMNKLISVGQAQERGVEILIKKEKSQALENFKKFKALVEKEAGVVIKCLRTDRGGEFNSKEFKVFCENNRIQRQLTTAYTPQQNGMAERKNRTLMNMVRSIISSRKESAINPVDLKWEDKDEQENNGGGPISSAIINDPPNELDGPDNADGLLNRNDNGTSNTDLVTNDGDERRKRATRAPTWMHDYVSGEGILSDEEHGEK